mgnify:CR=1 FL=1
MANNIAKGLVAGVLAASVLMPLTASADNNFRLGGVDLNITGYVRQEIAASVDDMNQFNPTGNPYNERVAPLRVGSGGGIPGSIAAVNGTCKMKIGPGCAAVPAASAGLTDDNPFNLFATRLELDIQAKFNDEFSAYVQTRVYTAEEDAFGDGNVGDHFGLTTMGYAFGPAGNKLGHLKLDRGWWGKGQLNPLEVTSDNVMLDFPSAYLDWHHGPFWLRVGQQQIAWGEALFFRVFDVVNGLDLRRHSFFDVAAEEYSDKRVASPGVRASYTFKNEWELEGFVQLFNPSILPAENTPYNIIPAQFVLDDSRTFAAVEGAMNFGFKLRAPITDKLTLQAMAVSRLNPDGYIRWADAPLTGPGGTPNPFCLANSPFKGLASAAQLASAKAKLHYAGACGSAFIPDPIATGSADEWFRYAGLARLDPIGGLATGVDQFAATQLVARQLLGIPVESNKARAIDTLNTFIGGFGPLRGWIERVFKREQVFGFGGNYIFESTPGSFLDQLIVRGEMSYTPNKKFTSITIDQLPTERDEATASVVLEKYQSILPNVPATYLVFEWMHKTESDMFGRLLDGNNTDGIGPGSTGRPKGQDAFDAVTFAFQQPFPNLIWRADFSVLYDISGSIFLQPGVRYKPSSKWQFDLYANIVKDLGNNTSSTLSTMDTAGANEVFARASFFF